MYLPSLHGAFFYTWEEDFSIQSLCLAAGGGPGVGVVNVSRQIASNLDAYGNWIYTDAIYCSYSFKADDAEYYGEQLTRIDAFTFGEVQSYCYMSTSEDRSGASAAAAELGGDASGAVGDQADTLSLQSAIVGYRWDKATGTARGLDVSTQVDEASRSGAALEGSAEETGISTRYAITRLDYTFVPDAEPAVGYADQPSGIPPGAWLQTGTRQESGSEVTTTYYQLEDPAESQDGQLPVAPAWREASLPREQSPRLVNEGQPSASETASHTESHLFTILSVLRGDQWDSTHSGVRRSESSVEAVAGPVADDSQASLETRTSVAVETYQMTFLAGTLTSGTTTFSGSTVNTERSEHRGNYENVPPDPEILPGIEIVRQGFGVWSESSEYQYEDWYAYTKIYDAAAPEDDPWLLSSGCSETTIVESTIFQDDAQGTYVKTMLHEPGPEDDEVIAEGFWDQGVHERYSSRRTIQATVDAGGAWVDSGSETFEESGISYANRTIDDAPYSRAIGGGTLAGTIGNYEGKIRSYGFHGTRTLTESGGTLGWGLASGCGTTFHAESTGPSYDGEGAYTLSGTAGSGDDLRTWEITGKVVEYGRLGDGEGYKTSYEASGGVWQATGVTAALYNAEEVQYFDTSTGNYTAEGGDMCGQLTQRDSRYSYRWDAFVWEDQEESGKLAGRAAERALLEFDNAQTAAGEIEEYYSGCGWGYSQIAYQREDSDTGSFRQATEIEFTLEEDAACGCGCGCGCGDVTYSWRHASGTLDERASREVGSRRWTTAPQEISACCSPDITEQTLEFDETDNWSSSRDERWEIVPEESALDHEDYYIDRVDVWELARGERLEKFHNDDRADERMTGIGSRTYDGRAVEGIYESGRERGFERTLTIEGRFDPLSGAWNSTYGGVGRESIVEDYAISGCYEPEASCGCGCECGCGCGCGSGSGCGGGAPEYDGTIDYWYSSRYETDRALSYQKAATQQAAYARTIYDGPTSFCGGAWCGCGCDTGIPSPRAWNNYGWSVSGSGQGAISESWHVDHTRQQDATGWVGGTPVPGVMTSSSYDDWSYDLTFTEEKPLGTSPYAWRYTGVEGEGRGLFCAHRDFDGSANYQTSVKQGTATLEGLKTYVETLTETNSYAIDFGLTAQGKIAFEIDGTATQSFDKKLTYEGETGTVVFGGGNGTISLDESGCAESRQRRQVDFSYRNGSYQAEVETTKTTSGHHAHQYDDQYAYSSEEYSYSSSAAWCEQADWENELTKRHSFANSTWPTLWTDRFTSYEQRGAASGGGSRSTSYQSSYSGCGCTYGSSESDHYDFTGCWDEGYQSATDFYQFSGGIDNQMTGQTSSYGCGCGSSYDETRSTIGFRWPTFTSPYAFDYVYPTRSGTLSGGLDDGCGCGCGCGIYGYETWAPRGRWSDTSSADTIGRMPTGSLIAPADLAAAADLAQELGALRELPLAPYATRTESTANYRRPNAIHGNGSPSLPQNAIFADWAHWRDHWRLNADLEEAIDLLALVQTPPAGGAWADKAQTPGLVVLDLYDTDGNRDNAFSFALAGKFTDAASVYGYRAPSGADALITASLASGNTLTVSVPEGSTADGMTAVTVVGYDAQKLPVAWTVVVHVVAVEGYTVEEQAWGETGWDAPDDSGADWALLWQCNKYRWLPRTTSGGLVTAANWSFASMAVDSSRQRWAYGTPTSTGEFLVNPSVTFGGSTIYFDSINTASVGLKRTAEPSADQPRVAATYVKSMEWEQLAWSREVLVEDWGTSTGMARLKNTEDGYLVYPDYRRHEEIQQPMDHTTVRVEVELAAPVPEGMLGSVHLAWYDPNNTVANLPASPPTKADHGTRDNDEDVVLTAAGSPLPGFTLTFTTLGRSETSDSIQKSYLAVADARYGDNFIVAAHPHGGIVETYEFRENASEQLVLMHQENTGLWKELPEGKNTLGELDPTVPDLQTSILTIFPSVDIDCDSDNTGVRERHGIERSDLEEQIENEADYPGKRVPYNNNDDNGNDIEDWLENAEYEYPAGLSWAPFTDLDLVPVVLDRGFADLTGMGGFVFELKVTIDRGLRYWLDQEKTPISSLSNTYSQDFWEAGKLKRVYRWSVTGGTINYPPLIYVEGIDPDAMTDTLIWRLFKPTEEQVDEDTVKMTDPFLVDLDIDSDNNGYINSSRNPLRQAAEDKIEGSKPKPITLFHGPEDDDDPSTHPAASRYVPLLLEMTIWNPGGRKYYYDYPENIVKVYRTCDESKVVPPRVPIDVPKGHYSLTAHLSVKAVGTGTPGGNTIKVIVVEADGTPVTVGGVEMSDEIKVEIQDNRTNLIHWVIPNDWKIDGQTLTTPTPVTGAVGPKIEGTGVGYNEYNTGDAYTRAEINGAFTMTFTVTYLNNVFPNGYVQPDNNGDENTVTPGDRRKLSWVANSGVKFGAVNGERPLEIALFDVLNMVDRVGGLETFNKKAVWGPNGEISVTYPPAGTPNSVRYETETLAQLLPCVRYKLPKGDYGQLYDLSTPDNPDDRVAVPRTWEDYRDILRDWYGFFTSLRDGYQVQIKNTASSLLISVYKGGNWVKVYEGDPVAGSYRLHLQAHWGSGVSFTNINLQND